MDTILDDRTKEQLHEILGKEKPKEEPPKETPKEPDKIDYEKIARSRGWKPRDEFSGEAWVGAEEFVKREPLFERIKSQSSEIKEMKKVMETMVDHFKKAQDVAVQKAIADLKTQKKEAIEVGDVEKVERLDEQIEQHKQIQAYAPTKVEIRPEIKEWVGRNPWFDTKPNMQKFALSFNKAYAADNPELSLSQVLMETEKAVKSRFPEEFKEKANPSDSPPPVETPSGEARVPKKGYTRDRLTPEQKRVYDQVVRHNIMTGEEYIKSLEQIGELQ